MRRKIKARLPFRNTFDARGRIRQINRILDKFATEDGFTEYVNSDFINLSIGGDSISVGFTPMTWSLAERFLLACVCNEIMDYGLAEYPYYCKMVNEYAAACGAEPQEFESF